MLLIAAIVLVKNNDEERASERIVLSLWHAFAIQSNPPNLRQQYFDDICSMPYMFEQHSSIASSAMTKSRIAFEI